MVALLLEVEEPGVDRDACLTAIREKVVPAVKSMSGFGSSTWVLVDGSDKWMSLSLYDTEAHAQAAIERLGAYSGRSLTGGLVVRSEVCEVAATA